MRRISDYNRKLRIRANGGIGKSIKMKSVKAKPMRGMRAK